VRWDLVSNWDRGIHTRPRAPALHLLAIVQRSASQAGRVHGEPNALRQQLSVRTPAARSSIRSAQISVATRSNTSTRSPSHPNSSALTM
jgi:hypothetical protein